MIPLPEQIVIPKAIPIPEPIPILESILVPTPESTLKSAPDWKSAPELIPNTELQSGRSDSELPPLVETYTT